MTIYCIYDHATSVLYSQYRYVIAQNNNLADVLNIKIVNMTDLFRHTYRIEFVCRTHGGAVKAKYSSPVLEYETEGLNFEIPNCLTQYEGYVEAQLVICEYDNLDVTIKSVGREGGIFEVAPSANVLETHIVEPGNVLTELNAAMLTVESLNAEIAAQTQKARELNGEIEGVFKRIENTLGDVVKEKMIEIARVYPSSSVDFVVFGDRVLSYTAVLGKLLPEPDVEIPSDAVLSGWYCPALGRHWDFFTDIVKEENVTLYADIRNMINTSFQGSTLTFYTKALDNVYLPFTMEGKKVETVRFSNTGFKPACTVYVNEYDYNFVNVAAKNYVAPYGSKIYTGGSSLIRKKDGKLVGAYMTDSEDLVIDLTVADGVDIAFDGIKNIHQIIVKGDLCCPLSSIADGISSICALAVEGNVITKELIGDFDNLQAMLLLSDVPQKAVCPVITTQYRDFKIYVPAQTTAVYAKNTEYGSTTLYPMDEYSGYDVSLIV